MGITGNITTLAIILGIIFIATTINIATPETGQHTGYITETGVNGLIFKTHFIKVVSSQMGYGDVENTWNYGICESCSNDVFESAKAFQANNTKVTVSYECKLFSFMWEQDSACIVTDIKEVK